MKNSLEMIERDRAIQEQRRSGKILKSIAEEYGLTRERVRQICSSDLSAPNKRLLQTKELLLEGKSTKEVSKAVGVSTETISEYRAKLKMPAKRGRSLVPLPSADALLEQHQVMSWPELGKRYGCDPVTVKNRASGKVRDER